MSTIRTQNVKALTGDGLPDNLLGVTSHTWISFNGTGTPTIKESRNISSITDVGAGRYDVNIDTALANTNGALVGSIGDNTIDVFILLKMRIASTTVVEIDCENASATNIDTENISFAIFGGLS